MTFYTTIGRPYGETGRSNRSKIGWKTRIGKRPGFSDRRVSASIRDTGCGPVSRDSLTYRSVRRPGVVGHRARKQIDGAVVRETTNRRLGLLLAYICVRICVSTSSGVSRTREAIRRFRVTRRVRDENAGDENAHGDSVENTVECIII